MNIKLKPNETLIEGASLADITDAVSSPDVTMVRLIKFDATYVLGYHIICSIRLEGDGKYNLRKDRKVIARHLTMEQGILRVHQMAEGDSGLIKIVKPIMTKRKLTVGDILKAVGRA